MPNLFIYGRVLRTHANVKSIFVSIGNYIDLEMSMQVVSQLISKESHIPLPIRIADLETHKMRSFYKHNESEQRPQLRPKETVVSVKREVNKDRVKKRLGKFLKGLAIAVAAVAFYCSCGNYSDSVGSSNISS